MQVGAQGRTGWGAYYTCRAIRNGIVGKVQQSDLLALRESGRRARAGLAAAAELDWDLWLGPLRWRPYNQAYHPAQLPLVSRIGRRPDPRPRRPSVQHDPLVHERRRTTVVHGRGDRYASGKGLWDCPVTMEVVFQFKDPEWTLVWGQPGDKLGKLEFGNVFWGENNERLVLEWEGAYKPAEPEAINFQMPPGGYEPYRTNEYPTTST